MPLNIGTTLYLDLGIYSLLQVRNGSFHDLYLSFNTLCAYVITGCFLAVPVLAVFFVFRNKSMLLTRCDDSFNQRWRMLLHSFSPSTLLVGPIFYFFFLIRRFVMVTTIFTVLPKTFALLNFSLSLTVLPT